LGFAIWKDSDGNTMLGHGGNCPGYRTALHIDLKNKRAYSVMINANGTNPWKYTNGINAILNKVESIDESEIQTKNLDEYVGYYNSQPWWSENYLATWNGKLVMLDLPSDKPVEAMTFYKYIAGDTFRRIRDNEELGETLIFERDKDGKITQYITHEYYSKKIDKINY
ncbi:MAG: hypothetical protein GWP19_07330, partial [Planctomycetia bacterium]|nr:hypothetical protein [Planctomycetia bacterium]